MKSSLAKAPAQEKRKKSELLPNWCGVDDRFPQMTKVNRSGAVLKWVPVFNAKAIAELNRQRSGSDAANASRD
jgi:hypothetical protein